MLIFPSIVSHLKQLPLLPGCLVAPHQAPGLQGLTTWRTAVPKAGCSGCLQALIAGAGLTILLTKVPWPELSFAALHISHLLHLGRMHDTMPLSWMPQLLRSCNSPPKALQAFPAP